MALGTPTDGGAAYSTNNGNTVAPAYPAVIAAGDCLVLIVGMKPSTANGGTIGTAGAISGWTQREAITAQGGYGTTLAADTGNTNLWIYTKDSVTGSETGNLSVTIGTNNISWGLIVCIPTDSGTLVYGSADGGRSTAPTDGVAFTDTLTTGLSGAPNLLAGDMAIWAMCIPTDVLNNGFNTPTISSSGTTFGTAVELEEPDSGTGNDIGGYVAYAAATSGSSTAAPTIGVTATGTVGNVRGPLALLRVRELPFINAESGSFTYTGQDASLADNRVVNAEAASFAYTGQDATLTKTTPAKEISAESGTFTYTGQDASLAATRNVNAEVGVFTYTGQDASLAAVRNISAESGTFTYTGQDASLAATRNVNAEVGVFTYTGQDASLAAVRNISAESGTFTYTGQNAELIYQSPVKNLNAETGNFAITGQPVTFEAAANFNAGIFVITGQDATFDKAYNLSSESGVFTYTGQSATLSVGFLYPPESDVRSGVVYGPGGIYIGTLVASKPIYLFDD